MHFSANKSLNEGQDQTRSTLHQNREWFGILFVFFTTLLVWSHAALQECAMQGWHLGKFACGIRVRAETLHLTLQCALIIGIYMYTPKPAGGIPQSYLYKLIWFSAELPWVPSPVFNVSGLLSTISRVLESHEMLFRLNTERLKSEWNLIKIVKLFNNQSDGGCVPDSIDSRGRKSRVNIPTFRARWQLQVDFYATVRKASASFVCCNTISSLQACWSFLPVIMGPLFMKLSLWCFFFFFALGNEMFYWSRNLSWHVLFLWLVGHTSGKR